MKGYFDFKNIPVTTKLKHHIEYLLKIQAKHIPKPLILFFPLDTGLFMAPYLHALPYINLTHEVSN